MLYYLMYEYTEVGKSLKPSNIMRTYFLFFIMHNNMYFSGAILVWFISNINIFISLSTLPI